jgi:hypothetical protein
MGSSTGYNMVVLGTHLSDCTKSAGRTIIWSLVSSQFSCLYVAGSYGYEAEEVRRKWKEFHNE